MSVKHQGQHHPSSRDGEQAMHEADAHTTKSNSHDHVPGDDTAHAHSHAAHLEGKFPAHVSPEGNVPADTRQNLNEPPQEVSRTGKGQRRE